MENAPHKIHLNFAGAEVTAMRGNVWIEEEGQAAAHHHLERRKMRHLYRMLIPRRSLAPSPRESYLC